MAMIGYGYERLQVLNLIRKFSLMNKGDKVKNFKASKVRKIF